MKILYITAGAAGMYCGSCLRDNALAAELLRQGHDVRLLPLYTPTLTDEPNVSQEKIFFGGISVYLQQHVPLFRRTPRLLDRLWDSRWALRMASKRSIAVDPQSLGEMTVSMLRGEDGHQRKELRKLIEWLKSEELPDLVNLPNSMLISLAAPLKRALDRPVVCTLQGEDLFLENLQEPYRRAALDLIRSQVAAVDGFIVISEWYAGFMADYLGIPEEKIHVVPLGITTEDYDNLSRPASDRFTVGYLARIAPEKGLHLLAEAYRRLRRRPDAPPARLEVAGYLAPEHRPYLKNIERKLRDWGLADEFRYHGAIDRRQKIEFLRSLDVLSVPATYDEPKGLFVLEGLAAGVPVVQPRRGAFTEMIEKTRGGLLVEPDDAGALAEGLHRIYRDRALAADLRGNGYEGVRSLYHASRMAERALAVYASVIGAPAERI